jgi:hypothetical protein
MAELTSKLYIAQAVVKWKRNEQGTLVLDYGYSDSQAKTGNTIFNTFD